MAFIHSLAATASVNLSGNINWLFLVESIVVVFLALFYFFYWSRLLGWLLGVIIRAFVWKSSNAYIEFEAVQFSLLAGRLLFKDLRYYSRNQSVRIHQGNITWRYWFWRVREEGDKPSASGKHMSCRLFVYAEGVEWFLYNRTPAYDAMLERLGVPDILGAQDPPAPPAPVEPSDKPSVDLWREMLPIEIRTTKGAVVLGNDATPSVVIAEFSSSSGIYAAGKSRSSLDEYRQSVTFSFVQPKIIIRTNPDYCGPILQYGELAYKSLKKQTELDEDLTSPSYFARLSSFAQLAYRYPALAVADTFSTLRGQPAKPWRGLDRYKTEDEVGPSHHPEYAKVMTLLGDCREMELAYYADVVGRVPEDARPVIGLESHDIGNGDLSPEWGVDVSLKGGTIHYGPWADRQRDAIQRAFTPTVFTNGQVTKHLQAGDLRMHTALKVFLEIIEPVKLRLPFREQSKDWEYDGHRDPEDRKKKERPYGWLDVLIGQHSTITYNMPMVSTEHGFDTLLELHLDSIAMTSSVNYSQFLTASSARVHCSMPSPLQWNALRQWGFSVTLVRPEIMLLREHVQLFTDLAKDWSSGPTGDYLHFVPFRYTFNLALINYKIFLYVNEQNVINNQATSLVDNAFIVLGGPRFDTHVVIPSEKYRATSTQITFTVEAPKATLELALPEFNTHSAFADERRRRFADVGTIRIAASYLYYASVAPDHVETLKLDIFGREIRFLLLGDLIKFVFNLRDNYFGSFTQSTTSEEWPAKKAAGLLGDSGQKWRPGKSDVFEVNVELSITESVLLLPETIYLSEPSIACAIPELQLVLRNNDYGMDMSLNVQPVHVVQGSDPYERASSTKPPPECLIIDGLDVIAHRLFGPQPATATYLCLWEIRVGQVKGRIAPPFLLALSAAGRAFGVNFSDKDNSLPPEDQVASAPDVTFFKLSLGAVDFAVMLSEVALQVSAPDGLALDFNDRASASYLKMISLRLLQLDVRLLTPITSARTRWLETASLALDAETMIYLSSGNWEQRVAAQSAFVREQDAETQRATFIYDPQTKLAPEGPVFRGRLHLPVPRHPLASFYSASDSEGATPTTETASSRSPVASSSTSDDGDVSDISEPSADDGRIPPSRSSRTASFATAPETDSSDSDSEVEELQRPSLHGARLSSDSGNVRALSYALFLPRLLFSNSFDYDEPNFRLTREARLKRDTERSVPSRPEPPKASFGRDRHFSRDSSAASTTVRVLVNRDISVLWSPLSTSPLIALLNALYAPEGLEQSLDALLARQMSTGSSTAGASTLILDVRVPVVRARAVCRNEAAQSSASKAASDSFSIGEASLESIDVSLRWTTSPVMAPSATPASTHAITDLQAAVDLGPIGVHCNVASVTPRASSDALPSSLLPTATTAPPGWAVLVFSLSGISAVASYRPERAGGTVTIGNTDLAFVELAADALLGLVASFASLAEISTAASARAGFVRRRDLRLVFELLRYNYASRITTRPAFLDRIAFLVANSSQRSRHVWKLLGFLRHTLRQHKRPDQLRVSVDEATNSDTMDEEQLLSKITELLGHTEWEVDERAGAAMLTTKGPPPQEGDETASAEIVPTDGAPTEAGSTAGPAGALGFAQRVGPAVVSLGTVKIELFNSGKAASHALCGPVRVRAQGSTEPDAAEYAHGSSIRPADTASIPPPPTAAFTLALAATIERITIAVTPALLALVRHAVGLERMLNAQHAPQRDARSHSIPPTPPSADDDKAISKVAPLFPPLSSVAVEISMHLRRVDLSASAADLVVSAFARNVHCTTSIAVLDPSRIDSQAAARRRFRTSVFFAWDSGQIVANEGATAALHPRDAGVLLALASKSARGQADAAEGLTFDDHELPGNASPPTARIILSVESVSGSVPKSLLALYRFLEHWRTERLPAFDPLLQEVFSSFERPAHPTTVPAVDATPSWFRSAHVSAQLFVRAVNLDVRTTPSLWFLWRWHAVLAHGTTSPRCSTLSGAAQIGRQELGFLPVKPGGWAAEGENAATSITLPTLRVSAKIVETPDQPTSRRLAGLVALDGLHLSVSMEVLDRLVAIYSRISADIDDALDVWLSARAKRQPPGGISTRSSRRTASSAGPASTSAIAYDVKFAFRSLRIAVLTPSAQSTLEAALVEGRVSLDHPESGPNVAWSVAVRSLALALSRSLAQSPAPASRGHEGFQRSYRSAYIVADVAVQNYAAPLPDCDHFEIDASASRLNLHLGKLHATMLPTTPAELVDLADYFATEIITRKKERAQDLENVRVKTQRVLEHLDQPAAAPLPDSDPLAWLDGRVVSVHLSSLGLALPLSADTIGAPGRYPTGGQASPAFLISAPSIVFLAQRGETAFATVRNLEIIFANQLNPSREDHFSASAHLDKNRIVFSEMLAEVHSEKTASGRQVTIASRVSGFSLGLDPSVVDHAFSLIDVATESQKRARDIAEVAFLAEAAESGTSEAHTRASSAAETRRAEEKTALTIRASFESQSARVSLYPSVYHPPSRTSTFGRASGSRRHHRAQSVPTFASLSCPSPSASPQFETTGFDTLAAPDIITLPNVTLSVAYDDPAAETSHPSLSITTLIHSSYNVIKPTVLPFIVQTVRNVERRLQHSPAPDSARTSEERPPSGPAAGPSSRRLSERSVERASVKDIRAVISDAEPAFGTASIAFSLQIDTSELRLEVSPSLYFALSWRKGGFLFTTRGGSQGGAVVCVIEGVVGALQHTARDKAHASVSGEIQGLRIAGSVAKRQDSHGRRYNALSVEVDGEIIFATSVIHLGDVFLFQQIWLDRMPSAPSSRPTADAAPSPAPPAEEQRILAAVLVRLRSVKATVDLGSSLGKMSAEIAPVLLRIRAAESRSLTLTLGEIRLTSQGRLAGRASIRSMSFETQIVDPASVDKAENSSMLQLQIATGTMDANFTFDRRRLLLLEIEPLTIGISDDIAEAAAKADLVQLRLAFTVALGAVRVIATVQTVPTLVTEALRISATITKARKSASSKLPSPRVTQEAKLSHAAKSALHRGSTPATLADPSTVAVVQRLIFTANRISLAIFESDTAVVHAETGRFNAELLRDVDEGRVHRKLSLSLDLFKLYWVDMKRVTHAQLETDNVAALLLLITGASDSRVLLGFPAAHCIMESDQATGSLRLLYKFYLTYPTGQQVEVTLNLARLHNLLGFKNLFQERLALAIERGSGAAIRTNTGGTDASFPSAPSSPAVPPAPAFSSIASPTIPAPPAAADAPPSTTGILNAVNLEYIPLVLEVQNPELRYLGEATPSTDWFGLKRASFPRYCHSLITLPLEGVVNTLFSVYVRQLRSSVIPAAETEFAVHDETEGGEAAR